MKTRGPRLTLLDQIGRMLSKGGIVSALNSRACRNRVMKAEEAREVEALGPICLLLRGPGVKM